jgi:HD-GYP domain-containing protein (c-di-GMP phosphodiesterase class II)
MMSHLAKERITDLEENFIIVFYRLIQSVKLYQHNSQIVKEYTAQFIAGLEKLIGDEEFTLHFSKGLICVQGEKLTFRRENLAVFQRMLDIFEQRGLEGLIFHPAIKDVSSEELLTFFNLLIDAETHDNPWDWLEQQKKTGNYPWLDFKQSIEKPKKETGDIREKTRTAYWQANASVKEVTQKLSLNNKAGVRKIKRIMQNMVEYAFVDESVLLCASTIREHDDYTYIHSVNVAILSLCLGNRIGLSRNSLTYLSICALFHDLGKVEVAQAILNNPTTLNHEEWKAIRKHPLSSVRQILMLRASHALKNRIMLGPFEHHLGYNLSGYPETQFIKTVSLFGRILQITDVYDAITSPRSYHEETCSPPEALSHLMAGAGNEFDSTLTKVFVAMMGRYPIGTLLQLDSGEVGLVMEYPDKGDNALPRVLLLVEEDEGSLKRGEVIDLMEKDEEKRSYKRRVLGCFQPEMYGIKAADFI